MGVRAGSAVTYSVGSLVKARGREWVVLPESDDEMVMVRPLGGTDEEVTGLLTGLETITPASFDLPDPTRAGDHRSARLLRDALRLGFRSSAGPFRSFGHIAVEPRPYQVVPLLMALKLDPVRLLIADDVGIGKTVEAALVARELLDQGDARRLAVLCPPHLAEQWQDELASKFHIEAELVLASTAARLERGLRVDQTVFDVHPYVIVSTDFIKSDRHRHDFLRTCPELVIVDEAHTCADEGGARRGRQQRHELVAGLASDVTRHLILVTATPHSGKEGAFRSLLGLLDPSLGDLPEDLSGPQNEAQRRNLARHLVQRRRADIRSYLDTATPFPERLEAEQTYKLSEEYRRLFDRVLDYARETVRDEAGGARHQRVRWWSALALLRSLASSPAAAAATLRTRASSANTDSVVDADDVGRRTVLDLGDDDEAESVDVTPGGDAEGDEEQRNRRRLQEMAREADALRGRGDRKLLRAAELIGALLADGFRPIVFCRFIATADYLAEELRRLLPRGTEVMAVTGTLPPTEREARIEDLAGHDRRVLVATDCLSEGINLQESFDAVFHYDLSWNPTRHEQREGRVDRFGQGRPQVRVVTFYGVDNQIDGIVLEVLLRKHKVIRKSLGISVPVPGDANAVIEAIMEGLLLRQDHGGVAERLPGFDEFMRPRQQELFGEWERAAERERRSQTMYAQQSIKVDEVARELASARAAVGASTDVRAFVCTAVEALGGHAVGTDPLRLDLTETPGALRDVLGGVTKLTARFELPIGDQETYLSRTHPVVEGMASYLLDSALDPLLTSPASRCGVIRTAAVASRTTLLLVRYRFHLIATRHGVEDPLLAEDWAILGFRGSPSAPTWLRDDEVEPLLGAVPSGNIDRQQAFDFLSEAINGAAAWRTHVDEEAAGRAEVLADTHRRVHESSRDKVVRYRVEPQLPADVLGVYIYLPAPRPPVA
jgi:superfamily II DNA or RNA helicase